MTPKIESAAVDRLAEQVAAAAESDKTEAVRMTRADALQLLEASLADAAVRRERRGWRPTPP
ncbi:hypothetical protein [Methylobacterium dankookense]|uniref:Uncharacterized protein n=1 Tax=Methylobacterium dankookense TaxID=560405 RepID=A0A564FZZ8_9HYPH|nr:hypothetical protein [Methylobacterium dankookense]GJD57793.1 hypothetical protein IFDJLNFL_3706 [Methylobacterium dankookense]VUF12961.1 hypothetical protein MTDSW087_02656 [Methylobacterium dankookense]